MSGDEDRSELAFDTLALAGCVLLPRLSISLIRGNIVLLALGVLVQEFLAFMLLASLTASGFLVALWVLGRGTVRRCLFFFRTRTIIIVVYYSSTQWGIGRISWMMLKVLESLLFSCPYSLTSGWVRRIDLAWKFLCR